MKEIGIKDLNKALKISSEQSDRLNRAMGLDHYKVKKGLVVSISPDGTEKVIKKAHFGSVKVKKRKFTLKDEQ